VINTGSVEASGSNPLGFAIAAACLRGDILKKPFFSPPAAVAQ